MIQRYGTLLVAALAIMGSPGPSTISLVAAAVAYGARRCVAYGLGLVAGTTVVLLATATGVTAILLTVPALHWVLIVVATGYLLLLAHRLATAPPLRARPSASSLRGGYATLALPRTASGDGHPTFVAGLALGVANPKAWIAIAAVFASTRLADRALADAALKVPVLALVVALIHAAWLLAGRLLMPALRDPRRSRVVNITLAVLLVAASVLALLP